MKKTTIFNDPIYGFIAIEHELILNLIETSEFQRLRRITQTGLTQIVFTSARHTRFQHALGCYHLMKTAIKVLRKKGINISKDEELGTLIAILLHDIGHGPFSHTLEHNLVELHHEEITLLFLEKLNQEFDGKLSLAIQIFKTEHPKKFLSQLVSSQLDIDRLDYLRRDGFFSGVNEGVINVERLVQMLNVKDNEIVIDYKGIYSVESFLISRRLMYWQVYLHKTSFVADLMLIKLMQEVKKNKYLESVQKGFTPSVKKLLTEGFDLGTFSQLDDHDIMFGIKVWQNSEIPLLSFLAKSILNRKLFKVKISKSKFNIDEYQNVLDKCKMVFPTIKSEDLVFMGEMNNKAYEIEKNSINILDKTGKVENISSASDQLNIAALSKAVTKYYLSFPKECV